MTGHPANGLDDTVHQRVRLGILTIAHEARRVEFSYLRDNLELTAGNLSQHLGVLENAGLITIEKGYAGKRARTWVTLTKAGPGRPCRGDRPAQAPDQPDRTHRPVTGPGEGKSSCRERMAPFADMLVVHELAHAFHDGVPFVFPRSWLMELFADLAFYAFVVAEEPDRRMHFETLPRVALEYRLLKPVARDLRYFEAFYPYVEPLTYVWYQFRFTMMAKGVIDAAGPNVLRRLWDAFALTDEQLAGVLGGRVHPAAGQWLASWDEPPQ